MQTSRITLLALAFGAILPSAYAQAPVAPAAPPALTAPAGHEANRVNGNVTSITNGSYTVTPRRDPTPVTFSLAPDVTVVRSAAGDLTNIQQGSPLRVEGTISADGTSISATRITVLASLPTHGRDVGKVTPNGKHVVGTVSSVTPLKITAGDGSQVSVDTTSAPRVMIQTPASATDIVVGSRVQVTLDKQGTAREVDIQPARAGRKAAAAL